MYHVCRVIHADEIHRKGIKGRGVTAAVMDSGICGHPDYADRVVCFVTLWDIGPASMTTRPMEAM